MKKITILALALMLLFLAGTASALIWSPTDVDIATGDVNTINLSSAGTDVFGIFALGSISATGGPADLAIAAVDRITFNLLSDNTWEIRNLAGDTFNLGASYFLHFAYFDGANWVEELSSFELAPGANIWNLTWGPGITLQAIDVRPIPVPPAVILLASGLLALAGMRRRPGGA